MTNLRYSLLLVEIGTNTTRVLMLAVNLLEVVQGLKCDLATENESLEEVWKGSVELVGSVLAGGNGKDLVANTERDQ